LDLGLKSSWAPGVTSARCPAETPNQRLESPLSRITEKPPVIIVAIDGPIALHDKTAATMRPPPMPMPPPIEHRPPDVRPTLHKMPALRPGTYSIVAREDDAKEAAAWFDQAAADLDTVSKTA
ncbi:MAG: hypothetical protein JWR83_2866, partial [Aeromicrobium sp.]|nr:hypothetical protein [Aeromicrobium sp.]